MATTSHRRPLFGGRTLSQSAMDTLFIVQILLNVIALAFVIWLTWSTYDRLAENQERELEHSQAVAACTTKVMVHGLRDIAREIGIEISLQAPSTEGLDCDAILGHVPDPVSAPVSEEEP